MKWHHSTCLCGKTLPVRDNATRMGCLGWRRTGDLRPCRANRCILRPFSRFSRHGRSRIQCVERLYLRTSGYKRRRFRPPLTSKWLRSSLIAFQFDTSQNHYFRLDQAPSVRLSGPIAIFSSLDVFAPYRPLPSQTTRRVLSIRYGTITKGMSGNAVRLGVPPTSVTSPCCSLSIPTAHNFFRPPEIYNLAGQVLRESE
jgi:hypothetical protein